MQSFIHCQNPFVKSGISHHTVRRGPATVRKRRHERLIAKSEILALQLF